MKARSLVLAQFQKPMTMFGVPTRLMVLTMGASLFGFLFFVLIELMFLSWFAFLGIFATGYLTIYKLNLKDPHFISVYIASKGSWGERQERVLLRGTKE